MEASGAAPAVAEAPPASPADAEAMEVDTLGGAGPSDADAAPPPPSPAAMAVDGGPQGDHPMVDIPDKPFETEAVEAAPPPSGPQPQPAAAPAHLPRAEGPPPPAAAVVVDPAGPPRGSPVDGRAQSSAEARWLLEFAETYDFDAEAFMRIPAPDVLRHLHRHLETWRQLLRKQLAPEGPLPPRAVPALVAFAQRTFAPEASRTSPDHHLHTAILAPLTAAQGPFLTHTLPAFLLGGHGGRAAAAAAAQLCLRLAPRLAAPADDLREVVAALRRLEDRQASVVARDERLELMASKLHSAVASRAPGHPDWAPPPDPEEERRRALLTQCLPRREDFFYPQAFHPSQLPVNVVQGLFRSVEDYFDAQQQLLRAEFFSNFIHGVHFKKFTDGSALFQLSPAVRHSVENGAYLYNNLRVLGTVYHPGLPGDGLAAVVQFRGPDPSLLDWGTTGCLQRGSLVCISSADLVPQRGVPFSEELFWGVVVDRDPRLLAFGVVVLQLLFHRPAQLAAALDARPPGVPPEPIMLENPLCFATAQRLLCQLKAMRDEPESRGPFSALFAESEPLLDPPAYQRGCDVEPVVQQMAEGLDAVQRQALASVKERCILLQGPAGTGKSHVAARILQAVLLLHAEPHARRQVDEGSLRLEANEQRLAALRADIDQLQGSADPEVAARLPLLEEEVRILSGPIQAHLYDRHAAMVGKLAALERRRGTDLPGPCAAPDSGPVVLVAASLPALDRLLATVLVERPPALALVPRDVVRIAAGPMPLDLSADVSDFHALVVEDLMHQEGPGRLTQQRLTDLRHTAATLLTAALTPDIFRLFATEEQIESFGPLTQEAIDRWLVDPDFLTKDHNPGLALAQQLRRLPDDVVTDAPGKEVPFTSWLEDGLPRPLFSLRADHYAALLEYPRLGPAAFLECFVPAPLAAYAEPPPPSYVDQAANLYTLSVPDRQELARRWMAAYKRGVQETLPAIDREYQKALRDARDRREAGVRRVLGGAQLIAGTVGSILAQADVLRPLNCSLLAVEDAPALLEAVLAGLVGAVQPQQLLLVGDPVHCRPALEVAAHGPRNFIDSPAFERFATSGFTGHVLTTQYRMAMPIQRLSLAMYGNPPLEDRVPSALCTRAGERAVVDGMVFEMYFWTHDHPEQECIFDGQQSWLNMQEVDMAYHLAEFLLAGGLPPAQLAILTPYKAQLLELLARCHDLAGVRIERLATAPSLQADVVILSLVTTHRPTEFLRSPHAAAWALTRARYGLYLLGAPGPMEGLVHWAPALEALSQPPPEVFDRLSPLHALVKTLTGTRLPVVAQDAGQDGALHFIRPGRAFTHHMTTQLQSENWRYSNSGMLLYHPPSRGRVVPLQGGFSHLVALRTPHLAPSCT